MIYIQRVIDSVQVSDYVQPIQQPEVVLTIAVHHPFRVTYYCYYYYYYYLPVCVCVCVRVCALSQQKKKDMEFQVLGSQVEAGSNVMC